MTNQLGELVWNCAGDGAGEVPLDVCTEYLYLYGRYVGTLATSKYFVMGGGGSTLLLCLLGGLSVRLADDLTFTPCLHTYVRMYVT